MVIANIMVSGANAKVVKTSTITKGMVGAQIELSYSDPMWDGMEKTVVFRGVDVKAVVDAGNKVTIPAEVLENAGLWLMVSVLGVEAETGMQIPTPWVSLGLIQEAAGPFDDASADPALPVWAQLLAMIGDLSQLKTKAKDNLVVAINEAANGGDSGGLSVTDDGNGNVTITSTGSVSITDDGNGNVIIG